MAEENTTDKKDTTGLGQFDLDKIAGVGMSGRQAKEIDTKAVDEQIAALEKPASGSVYDKLAARYRSQGEGAVLRSQKNLTNLFGPTVNLIQEREADAQARFTLLKDKLPEFDDTKIFGMQSGNEMPIVAEIESISKTTKEDMRMLSRLNPNDERYDEIKKRIDKNQNAIVAFDEINQKLLEIRNSQDGREDDSQWSRGMDSATRQMWEDIYASKGENITIQDGKLVWTSTGGKSKEIKTKSTALNNISSITEAPTEEKDVKKLQKNLQDLGYDIGSTGADGKYGPKTKAAHEKFLQEKEDIQSEIDSAELEGVGETRVIDLNEIGDGPTMIDNLGIKKDIEIQNGIQALINSDIDVTTPGYESQVNALIRTLNSAGPKGIKSLIFDGFGAQPGDVLKSTNTDSFIQQIIQNNSEEFGIKDINNLTEEEIANAYEIMRSRDVTHQYKNSEGKSQTLQSQYLQWYRNEIDTKVREGKKSKLVAAKIEQQNKNNTTTTTTDVPDPEEMTVDNRSGRSEALTTDQRNTMWKIFYDKSEGDAEAALQAIFPNFVFTHKTPMFDVLEIRDGEGNKIGTYDFDFGDIEDAKAKAQEFLNDLDNMGYNTFDNSVDTEQTQTTEDPEETSEGTNEDTDDTKTFRDTMGFVQQKRVNKFNVMGSSGTGKADIFKGNNPITAEVQTVGGLVTISVTGVEARGNDLVVTTSAGDQDMGSFVKSGDGYKFKKGSAYKHLSGEDKKDFNAFVKAIESDNAFAQQVLASVQGDTDFIVKDY